MAKKKTKNARKKKLKIVSIIENKKNSPKKGNIKQREDKTASNEKPNINDKKVKRYKLKNIILILLLVIAISVVSLIIAFFLYIIFTTEEFDESKLYNKEASVLLDKNGNEYARLGAENRETKSYEELPQVLVDAIVAVEDSRFFQHNGLDIARFAKASVGQLLGQSGAGGASTLTMQIAKLQFNGSEAHGLAGIVRKFRDIYVSVFQIEKNYTKEDIIELYVNTPYLGAYSYGVEQASQAYFGKSVSDLTLPEASLLAGIFNAPSSYNPYSNLELATKRRSVVLNLMVQHGYITEEQREDAEKIKVASLLNPDQESIYGYNKYQAFVDVVRKEISEKTGYDPASVPMIVETTLDPDMQDVLNDINDKTLYYYDKKDKDYPYKRIVDKNGNTFVDGDILPEEVVKEFGQGKPLYTWKNEVVQTGIAITSMEDGSITAVNGGRHYNGELLFNRATDLWRHPGSTAKPIFDYGPYIEYNGGSTYSPFFDNKMSYTNGGNIKNSDDGYQGMLTMRQALSRSRNIPAVQAFQQVDKSDLAWFVQNLGIKYGDELFESMAIGGFNGVSPVEMSAAYAAFGRKGYYIEPFTVKKITYIETGESVEFRNDPVKVMSEETAYMITDILMTATANGVGGTFNNAGQIASKTGTSTYSYQAIKDFGINISASQDNWVNTYSPDYSISIWYGYDKLTEESAANNYYTMPIDGANQKKAIMSSIVKTGRVYKKGAKFDVPSGIVKAKVELETFPAQSPSEFTPSNMIITELFRKGTEPSEISNRYSKLENPSNAKVTTNGSIATITWDAIRTPEAIDANYLKEHYEKYYTKWADDYYNKRINYNNSNIGNIGYEVYQNVDGNLISLGYTTNNSFSTTCTGSCTFVIKSAYSIFKANMSDGVSVTTSVSDTPIQNPSTQPNNSNLDVEIYDVCLPVSDTIYNDEEYTENSNPIIITSNGRDITNSCTISRDTNEIDRSMAQDAKITYTITCGDKKTKASRNVKISNRCT